MVNTVWVNVDQGRDFHPIADHIKKIDEISPRKKIAIF